MSYFPSPNDSGKSIVGAMDRVPHNVSFLATQPDWQELLSEIGFNWHSASQHISINNFQPPSYYEDYIMTATYSEKMQTLQRSQMQRLIALHDCETGPSSFVEIGCGDGSFMKYAKEKVTRVLGIEASHRFAQEATENGFDVIIGYVGSKELLTEEKFDSFASRQVFEHLPDPIDVLTGIVRMLNPGAVGLIEVPNGQRALRLKRFFEFFPDHVNYYSVNSLVALASTVGLNVISCNEAFSGDYLELWVRNDPNIQSRFSEMLSHREEVCARLECQLSELAQSGQRVAVWGCGAKTLCIFAASSPVIRSTITCIIDSDPHKHGRYVPNSDIPVVSPETAKSLSLDVVLILALSYREEIAASVREKFTTCKTIITLDDHGCIRKI